MAAAIPLALAAQTEFVGAPVVASSGLEVMRFAGIRYAEAPVGKRRWSAPQPAAPVGRVPALDWPAACLQDDGNVRWYQGVAAAFGQPPEVAPKMPPVSEDCLFLNVWTPDIGARLPVMVWIHGGGNVNGWSFEPNYRGAELAARNVVVVSIQYRLGLFGFLAHPRLSAESPAKSSGNYGVLDQIEALRWIRRHIHRFGGDPGNITLFGESAGAGNIAYLLLSPLANGLFHRAISQSGGWPADQRRTLADNEAQGKAFLAAAGAEGIEALRAMPAAELLKTAAAHFIRDYDDPPVDSWLLPVPPAELLARRAFLPRPVIFGVNANEGLLDLVDPKEEHWRDALAETPDGAAVQALLGDLPLRERLDALRTAVFFDCPSRILANGFAAASAAAYYYRFDRVRPGGDRIGAYHGAEIPYVFNRHDAWLPSDATDRALTERMMRRWLRFAATGDPNDEGLPPWPRWTAKDRQALLLDGESRAERLDGTLCSLVKAPESGLLAPESKTNVERQQGDEANEGGRAIGRPDLQAKEQGAA